MNITFFNKIKYVIIIGFSLLLVYLCANNIVYASETDEDYESIKYIEEYLNDIQSKIKYIDEQINDMKSQKEYTKYPAVRLNVQTPFLGIAAITESKLNIKDGVSVIDRNYSLRDVINKKVIKVPSFSIGSITILTKELDLKSDKLSAEDINLALYYLKIYLTNAEQVVSFVEQQKNNIFFDYVPKDIKERIQENNNKIQNIKKDLISSNEKLSFVFLTAYDSQEYSKLEKSYSDIYSKINEKEEKLKNILITSQELDKEEKDIENIQNDFKKYSSELDYIYDMECLNIDQLYVIDSLYKEVEDLENLLKEYISASKKEIKIEKIENIKDADKEKNAELEDFETKVIYKVFNEEVVKEVENLKNDIIKYKNNIKSNENTETINRVYTNEQYVNFVKDYTNKYVQVLKSVCKFYDNNYKYILQDTTIKTDEIIKNTDENVAKYMRDLYFNVPEEVKEVRKYDLSSITHIKKYIKTLSKNIGKLATYNIELNKIYERNVEEGKIKS